MKRELIGRVLSCIVAVAPAVAAEQPLGQSFPPPSSELLVAPARAERPKGMHPRVTLRDRAGQPVVASGGWVSFSRSCGECHDTDWIGQHGYHFRVGVDEQANLGKARSGRAWDFGPGLFGRWDPLAGYDSLLTDPNRMGAAVDRWIGENLGRLVGGGPALLGEESRAYEPNCAICHVRGAAVASDPRLPLVAHQSAGLEALGLVRIALDASGALQPSWNRAAFAADGSVDPAQFVVQAPSSEACGSCHGIASRVEPKLSDWGEKARLTETTGQLFVANRISDSTLNVAGRAELARPWDVHAERLLECRDCHFSLNDPSAAFRSTAARPEHLRHEVRNLSLGEFLRRPSHELAKGYSTQGHVNDELDGTMRRCEDCHDARRVHRWLPKVERHLEQVGCETCHIESLHAPSRRVTDYSVIDAEGHPRVEYRGLRGNLTEPAAYLPAYRPLLLRRVDSNGRKRLLPYNIITSFYWVVDEPEGCRPASIALLKRAQYDIPGAAAKLKALLDHNHDAELEDVERVLSSASEVDAVKAMLVAAGAKNPRLVGEMQAYGIHHGVAPARFALRDCGECHGDGSRLAQPFELAVRAPFGIQPGLVGDSNLIASFSVQSSAPGQLLLMPEPSRLGLHVFGLSRRGWLDRLGLVTVGLVLAGALGHGAMRAWSRRNRQRRSL